MSADVMSIATPAAAAPASRTQSQTQSQTLGQVKTQAASSSPSVEYAKGIKPDAGDLFEQALKAARLLTNEGKAPGAGETKDIAFLTGGAGQNSIGAKSANKVAAELMMMSEDDTTLLTALEMFVDLAGEGGILDLTSTDFDTEHREKIKKYLCEIGISPDDADKLLRLLGRLKTAGAQAVELLDFTDEDTKAGVGLTEEEKRENVDRLAQIADLLYPQMDAPDFEAALDFIKVTPDSMIVTNQNIALVLIPQFDKEISGDTQYMRQSDIINALYTLDGMTEEQLADIKNQLDAGDFTLGEAVKAIAEIDRMGDVQLTDENGEPIPLSVSHGRELTEKEKASEALTAMVRAFRRENNADDEPLGNKINFEGRLFNIRTGTFEDRVIRSYETDDNTENSESGADDAANSDNSAQTENAGANIQNQNSAQPNTNAAAANMHGAAIPQTIHVQTVRTEVVTGPTVFDPPEVQLAGRIMSMDLTVSEVQEMTVVLNPEALGEVAVKVTNQNGAVSVALSAANPETQKILADTAAALSQSLKQGGADIREVLVIAAAEAGSQMGLSLGADGFTRQPGEGQNADGTNRSTVNGIGGINDAEIEASEENAEVNYESRGARLWQTA